MPRKTCPFELITATGSVDENGATALIFAHEGVPEEIAAEASRLFLGVQIQCANCHNHPWDRWKTCGEFMTQINAVAGKKTA